VLCPLLWVTLLGQGAGLGDPRGPCQPHHSEVEASPPGRKHKKLPRRESPTRVGWVGGRRKVRGRGAPSPPWAGPAGLRAELSHGASDGAEAQLCSLGTTTRLPVPVLCPAPAADLSAAVRGCECGSFIFAHWVLPLCALACPTYRSALLPASVLLPSRVLSVPYRSPSFKGRSRPGHGFAPLPRC